MSFFAELRRRNVIRVGIAYVLIAWVLLQAADFGLDLIDAPNWVIQALFLLALIGLPGILIFSYIFEMTPEGIKLETEIESDTSIAPRTGRKLDRVIIAVLVLVIAMMGAERLFLAKSPAPGEVASGTHTEGQTGSVTQAGDKTIAVLPFADLSQNQDQGWFADGLAEEILNALAKTPDLQVASRTSSFQFKDSTESLEDIAAALGVAHVLEGSVRSSDERIRVTAQLIRASDGFHLWSENYDRDIADMIGIQEDLALSIAAALETSMDPEALAQMAQVGTRSIEAYQAYLRGVQLQLQSLTESEGNEPFNAAYDYFERAREIDPTFAEAHLRAADFWKVQMSPNRTDTGGSDLPAIQMLSRYNERIEAANKTAKSEADRLRTLADKAGVDLRLNESVRLYQQYLALRPFDEVARWDMATFANMSGNRQAALEAVEHWQSRSNDNYSGSAYVNVAHRVIDAGDATDFGLELLQRFPNNEGLIYQTHRALLWAGRFEEAAVLVPRYEALIGGQNPIMTARDACARGDRAAAERALASVDFNGGNSLSSRWLINNMLGNRQAEIDTLKVLENRGVPLLLSSFLNYPQFDPSPFPEVMAVLEREGIDRPPPVTVPFQCPPPDEISIAVLPFVNMSADPDKAFFSDGVSEEILNVLARMPELKVAARTSAFAFRDSNSTVAEIARELGVNHVLEGSVRKAGNTVRVTAQLIKADDGFHLWSETYDRELDNIFAIQDEIAENIAEALKVTFAMDVGAANNLTGTNSLEAYEHYLRGIGLWHERTADSLRQALDAFEAARVADPNFAKAYAGMALTWTVWSGYILSDSEESGNNAQDYATTAIRLDPLNFEAYAALGNAVSRFWEEWDEAEANYKTAIDLNPSYATAYQWYGRLKFMQGDYEAARMLMEKALSLDPRSRIIGANLAWVWLTDNQFEPARAQLAATVSQHPDFPDGWEGKLTISMLMGDCAGVLEAAERLVKILHKEEDSSGTYVRLCEADTLQARQAILQEMLSWGPFDFHEPGSKHLGYDIDLWVIATELEAFDAATDLLEQMTIQWTSGDLAWLRNDQRPNAIRFNCTESALSMYREKNAAPARDANQCRE